MLLTGRWIEADEAAAWRLVSRLCTPGRLLDDAVALAADLAKSPTEALVATKHLLLAARSDAVAAAMHRELTELGRLMKASGYCSPPASRQ